MLPLFRDILNTYKDGAGKRDRSVLTFMLGIFMLSVALIIAGLFKLG
jgi:hypothetical protein